MIQIRLLGAVEVTSDGDPPPPELLWKKNLALLVYLARSPRRARTRDHLIGLFWGDRDHTAARHSLREAVRVIRKAVGEGAVESSGDQIRLEPAAVALDTTRFEELASAEDWEAASALDHGEIMEGFGVPDASGFEDWLASERMSWRQRCGEVSLRAARARLARGDALGAVALSTRVIEGDARAGGAVEVSMQAHALLGDLETALAIYERHAADLAAAGKARPGPELQTLAERLRHGRHWKLPASITRSASDEARARRAPLVGVGLTLAALVAQWDLVRTRRRSRTVLLGGAPGHGKSRMSEELSERAALDGATVIRIRAVPGDRSEPFSALLGLARGGLLDAPGVAAAVPDALAAFAQRIPEWADRFGGSVLQTPPAQMGLAFVEVIRAATVDAPLLLAIDDADWLDEPSFRALESATRDLADAPVLGLFCWGENPSGTHLDDLRVRLGREVEGTTFFLDPLNAEALEDLARWALPSFSDAEIGRVARRVHADSAGIPLLAVELIRAITLGMELKGSSSSWPASRKTLDQTLPGELPDVLIAAIRVGVRALSQAAQSALVTTAVLGDRVAATRIGRGSGLDGATLAGALDELEWQRWLSAEARGYSFVARIVREVVLQDLVTAGQRQRILDAVGPNPD